MHARIIALLAACSIPVRPACAVQTPSPQAAIDRAEARLFAGRIEAGLAVLDSALRASTRPGDRRSRGRILAQRGKLLTFKAFLTNDGYQEALAALAEAEQIATESQDLQETAKALLFTGFAYYARTYNTSIGGYTTPEALFERARELRRGLGDTRGEAEALFYLGLVRERQGDVRSALEAYRASLALARRHGHRLEESYAVRHIAFIMQARGDLDGALAGFERSLMLRQEVGFRIYLPFSHLAVGDVLLELGDATGALQHDDEALALARDLDLSRVVVLCLLSRGDALRRLGDEAAARRAFTEARDTAIAIEYERGAALAGARLEALLRQEGGT